MKKISTLILVVLFTFIQPAAAQSKNQEQNKSIIKTLTAIKKYGMADITGSLHPSDLLKIRNFVVELCEQEKEAGLNAFQKSIFGDELSIEKIKSIDNYTIVYQYLDLFASKMLKANTRPMLESFSLLSTTREGSLYHALVRTESYAPPNNINTLIELTVIEQDGKWKVVLPATFDVHARLQGNSVYRYAIAMALMLGLDPSVTMQKNRGPAQNE